MELDFDLDLSSRKDLSLWIYASTEPSFIHRDECTGITVKFKISEVPYCTILSEYELVRKACEIEGIRRQMPAYKTVAKNCGDAP